MWLKGVSKAMPRGEEGGTLDFKWQGWLNGGKNQNPQKFLDQNLTPQKFHAQFLSNKNFRKALKWYNMKNRNVCNGVFVFVYSYTAGIHGNYHESSDCFEYPPKNPYLNQATKKILAKIFLLKKFPEIKNFKPKKILQSSLSLEIQRTPTGRLSSQDWKPFALVWNHTGFTWRAPDHT